MKVNYKGLEMEFQENEGSLAGGFFTQVLEAHQKIEKPTEVNSTYYPYSNAEIIKQQNEFKMQLSEKDRTIADLTNRLNQATSNYSNIKAQYDTAKTELDNSKKDWERQDELDECYTTIKNKTEEIIHLQKRIKELETQPGCYSTGMADALKNGNVITEEEHQKLINNVTMGRPVTTYWDEFDAYIGNNVECPIEDIVDFGRYSVVNCTPHPVVLRMNNRLVTIPKSEVVTRIEFDHSDVELQGSDLPLVVENKGKLINVPFRNTRTLYIVSRIVFDVCVDREDFICPCVMRAERSNGQVTSVPSFVCRKELIEKDLSETK